MSDTSPLERYYLAKFLLEVSIATLEKGGATANLQTYRFLDPIDAWGLPRYPEKKQILAPQADIFSGLHRFIHINRSYLSLPGSWLGTWIDPLTGCCYLDITEIFPTLEEAHAQARQHNATNARAVVAIYNFRQQQTLYLQEDRIEPLPYPSANTALATGKRDAQP